MSANKFTDEFKRDAVAQVEDRGYGYRKLHHDPALALLNQQTCSQLSPSLQICMVAATYVLSRPHILVTTIQIFEL